MTAFRDLDETAIRALVDRFYARVRTDPQLGPVFQAAVHDWDAHLETLQRFWSSVMLSSGRYHGDPLAAHRPLPIAPELFERWLGLWRETARELFAPELADRFIAKAERIAQSLQLALFFRPDQPDRTGAPPPRRRTVQSASSSS